MSHMIGKNDKQQGITQAWHGLTEVLPVISLLTCFLSTWDVTKRKLFRVYNNLAGVEVKEETTTCEIVCTDDPSIVIGKPVDCNTYTVLDMKRFLAIVADSMAKIRGAYVASVGSVCDRARQFVSVGIPSGLGTIDDAIDAVKNGATASIVAAGREFQFYLSFLNSFDKSAPFTVVYSSICVVCNNTFNGVLADKDGKRLRISIPHTKNMQAALKDVPAIVDAFFVSIQVFADTLNALALVPINAIDAKAFFAGFLTEKGNSQEDGNENAKQLEEISTRRENQIDRLVSLFVSGKGNNGANLADLFSAITDYYSHESSGGEDAGKQIASSEFGNGAAMKSAAFAILKDDKRIAELIAIGHTLLANRAATLAQADKTA